MSGGDPASEGDEPAKQQSASSVPPHGIGGPARYSEVADVLSLELTWKWTTTCL